MSRVSELLVRYIQCSDSLETMAPYKFITYLLTYLYISQRCSLADCRKKRQIQGSFLGSVYSI